MIKKVNGHWMFTDSFYSFGKKFVQVYLPAISSFYFGLGKIWGLPYVTEIVGSLALLATFIGVVLGVSSSNFDKSGAGYDGNVITTTDDQGKKQYSLEFHGPIDTLDQKDSLKFKMT